MNAVIVGAGDPLVGSLGAESGTQETVGECFTFRPAVHGTVQPIVYYGGTPAHPVGVVITKVAKKARDTRKVRYKPHGHFEMTEGFVGPDKR